MRSAAATIQVWLGSLLAEFRDAGDGNVIKRGCTVKNNMSGLGSARALALALLAVNVLAPWTSATAADPPAGCSTSAGQITCVFAYTGGPQTWIVPAGATSATFYVYGAQGGTGIVRGGFGGIAFGTTAVTSGTAMQIDVGGQGASASSGGGGGWNGGGTGYSPSGGGGGGSDVRDGACAPSSTCTLADRLIVGGGGGGGAGVDVAAASYYGGDGGGIYGTDGYPESSADNGKRALSDQGGAGGPNLCGGPASGSGGAGFGGAGAHGCTYNGAGGGGGYFGGGGGGALSIAAVQGYSGGGGSGFIDPAMTHASFIDGDRSGNGLVIVVSALKAPIAAKSFSKTTADVGESVTLTFTLTNPNPVAPLTFVGLIDDYPPGLVNVSPSGLREGCNGGVISSDAGGSFIDLGGGTLPGGGICTFAVTVKGYTAGIYNNIADAVTSDQTAPGNAASASLTVGPPAPTLAPTAVKSFSQLTAAVGESVTLTFTITNPNPAASITGVQLHDIFPTGLVSVSPSGLSAGCNGGVVSSDLSYITLADGTIAPGGTCTYAVTVQGTGDGTYVNTTLPVSADIVGNGNTASATLKVGSDTPTLKPSAAMSFSQSTAALGESVTLTFTITNPNPLATITGVSLTQTFNATYLKNASPAGVYAGCNGGSIQSDPWYISLIGGTIPGGGTCSYAILVQGSFVYNWLLATQQVNAAVVGLGNSATASLDVGYFPPVANAVNALVDVNSASNPIALNITSHTATSAAVASIPAHGTAIASGMSIGYTPAADYSGYDSFTYTASNAGGTSAPATVSVTVGDDIFHNGME